MNNEKQQTLEKIAGLCTENTIRESMKRSAKQDFEIWLSKKCDVNLCPNKKSMILFVKHIEEWQYEKEIRKKDV
jgi:hypothetical protein